MRENTNESICSQCNGICEVVPMEEKEFFEYNGTNKLHVTKWNESSCCGADVKVDDE